MTLALSCMPAKVAVDEIWRLMQVHGIPSWSALARRAGISTVHAYRIRDGIGSPTLDTVSKIAHALGPEVRVRDIILDVPDDDELGLPPSEPEGE